MKGITRIFAVTVIALAFLFSQQGCASNSTLAASKMATIETNQLQVSDIVFNNNYRGPGSENKPENGFYAAKWWKGKPQVMAYKNASRDNLSVATLNAIIEHLSANRPQAAADMANENFARREFSTETSKVVVDETRSAAKMVAAPVQSASRLMVSDIVFNNNYRGPGSENKPENDFYAAKWWKGQPQVMSYKSASQDGLSAATLEVILDHLSANRPRTAADMANENFARREFSNAIITSVAEKTVKAQIAPLAETNLVESKVAVAPASNQLGELIKTLEAERKELAAIKASVSDLATKAEAKAPPAVVQVEKKAQRKKATPAFDNKACVAKLKELGYEETDGIKKFQGKYILKVDGVAGQKTCDILSTVLAACTDCGDEKTAKPAETK